MALDARHYGSRHAGTGAWLLVRITAVMIALGLLAIVALLAHMPSATYDAWRGLFDHLAVRLLFSVWLLAIALHAYLGCDNIVKDYVHVPLLRLVTMTTIAAVLLSFSVYGFVVFFL